MKKDALFESAQALIEKLVQSKDSSISWIPGLADSNDFLAVVAEYLKHFPQEAENKTETFIYWLNYLMRRFGEISTPEGDVVKYKLEGFTDVTYDKKWIEIQNHWKRKKEELIHHLSVVVDIFESGQSTGDHIHSSLLEFAARGGEDVMDCEQVRRWIEVIKLSPVDYLFPAAKPDMYGGTILQEQVVGSSGKASDSESATRGAVARKIAQYIPETLKNKYSITAKLSELIGIKLGENGRQYVASLAKVSQKKPLMFLSISNSNENKSIDVSEVLSRSWAK